MCTFFISCKLCSQCLIIYSDTMWRGKMGLCKCVAACLMLPCVAVLQIIYVLYIAANVCMSTRPRLVYIITPYVSISVKHLPCWQGITWCMYWTVQEVTVCKTPHSARFLWCQVFINIQGMEVWYCACMCVLTTYILVQCHTMHTTWRYAATKCDTLLLYCLCGHVYIHMYVCWATIGYLCQWNVHTLYKWVETEMHV